MAELDHEHTHLYLPVRYRRDHEFVITTISYSPRWSDCEMTGV